MNIIYIRTSTEEQNPENQLKDCKSINQWEEAEIFAEKQSAYNDKNRIEFEKVLNLIKKGKVEHLIVWDWDRLFRNRKKLIEFFEFCKIYKCKIHSVRQAYFEDFYKIPKPFDEIVSNLVLNLMGHMAEEESKKKGERVKLAIRKKNGVTKSYKGNKWGRKPLKKIDDRIIELYKEGKKYREICEEVYYWDKNNHKKFVSLGYVHKILANVKEENNSKRISDKSVNK